MASHVFCFRPSGPLTKRIAFQRGCRQQRIRCQMQEVSLQWSDGRKERMPKPVVVVGCQAQADVKLVGQQVDAEHAKLELKGGRLFCTALSGDPELLLSPTRCWLDGSEMRAGVAYMVAPGACLAFGTPENTVTVQFAEQGGSNAMVDMLFKGMASQASEEVQQHLDGL